MSNEKFWNQKTEPMRAFRWWMRIGSDANGIESYTIKTVKKPSFAISETQHQYVAHTFYYPGRITWNPVDITFVDPVDPSTSKNLKAMLAGAGYKSPTTEEAAKKSFSKKTFGDTIGEVTIHQIDTEGNDITGGQWSLINPFITSADFGQLDYSSEDLVVNSITLRYDYAIMDGAEWT